MSVNRWINKRDTSNNSMFFSLEKRNSAMSCLPHPSSDSNKIYLVQDTDPQNVILQMKITVKLLSLRAFLTA